MFLIKLFSSECSKNIAGRNLFSLSIWHTSIINFEEVEIIIKILLSPKITGKLLNSNWWYEENSDNNDFLVSELIKIKSVKYIK